MSREQKPKLAVWKFASCDGCQLSLLDLADELLALADRLQIAQFLDGAVAVEEAAHLGSAKAEAQRRADPTEQRHATIGAQPDEGWHLVAQREEDRLPLLQRDALGHLEHEQRGIDAAVGDRGARQHRHQRHNQTLESGRGNRHGTHRTAHLHGA